MRHRGWWLHLMGTWVALWEECGENLLLFCYRIGMGTFFSLRSRVLVSIPVPVRNEPLCWNPSATCSTPSIAPRDFEN